MQPVRAVTDHVDGEGAAAADPRSGRPAAVGEWVVRRLASRRCGRYRCVGHLRTVLVLVLTVVGVRRSRNIRGVAGLGDVGGSRGGWGVAGLGSVHHRRRRWGRRGRARRGIRQGDSPTDGGSGQCRTHGGHDPASAVHHCCTSFLLDSADLALCSPSPRQVVLKLKPPEDAHSYGHDGVSSMTLAKLSSADRDPPDLASRSGRSQVCVSRRMAILPAPNTRFSVLTASLRHRRGTGHTSDADRGRCTGRRSDPAAAPELGTPLSTTRNIIAALAAAAAVVALSGCGGVTPSGAGPSAVQSGAAAPQAPEVNPQGDIPDNQAFVVYTAPDRSFTMKVPEGWARTDADSGVVFSDKFNSITLTPRSGFYQPTEEYARSVELPKIASDDAGFVAGDVKTVQRPAGQVVLVTYRADSPPSPVTGKAVPLGCGALRIFRSRARSGGDLVVARRCGQRRPLAHGHRLLHLDVMSVHDVTSRTHRPARERPAV